MPTPGREAESATTMNATEYRSASPGTGRLGPAAALLFLFAASAIAHADGSGAQTPSEAVSKAYAAHFAGDMAFTHESVARKQPWLTPDLQVLLAAELDRPQPEDEPQYINGDPFTDTQEYPLACRAGGEEIVGDTASVRVDCTLAGGGTRRIVALLQRLGSAWMLSDLQYEDGRTLRHLLIPP
jgi:hypothetical protein